MHAIQNEDSDFGGNYPPSSPLLNYIVEEVTKCPLRLTIKDVNLASPTVHQHPITRLQAHRGIATTDDSRNA